MNRARTCSVGVSNPLHDAASRDSGAIAPRDPLFFTA